MNISAKSPNDFFFFKMKFPPNAMEQIPLCDTDGLCNTEKTAPKVH